MHWMHLTATLRSGMVMVMAFSTGGGLEQAGAFGCPVNPSYHFAFPACFQDTWIFPNILLFYPEAARAILEYRIRTLEGALLNAQEQGYEVGTEMWGCTSPRRTVRLSLSQGL